MGDISFSPDSKQVSTVHPRLGSLNTYNSHSGELIRSVPISALSGFSLRYGFDDSMIYISGFSGVELLRNYYNIFQELPSNYEMVFFEEEYKQSSLVNLQYTDDSQQLFATGLGNGKAILDIWDLDQVSLERINLPPDSSGWITLSENGKNVIRFHNRTVELYSKTGEIISTLEAELHGQDNDTDNDRFFSVFDEGYAFPYHYSSSYDGKKIATIGLNWDDWDRPIYVWNLTQGDFKRLEDNSITPFARQVIMSPDGNYIVGLDTTGNKVMGYLWDGAGNLVNDLYVHNTKEVQQDVDVLFSGIGLLLSDNFYEPYSRKNIKGINIIQMWKNSTAIQSGLQIGDLLLEVDGRPVSEFEDSLDTYQILNGEVGSIAKLKIYRAGEIQEFSIEREKLQWPTSDDFIRGDRGKFSPNSKYLLTWIRFGKLLLLRELESQKVVVWNPPADILNVYPSPDNKLIAVTGSDYTIRLLDYSGNLIRSIKLQQSANDLAFSPDGQKMAFLGYSNELIVMNLTGKILAKYTIPEDDMGLVPGLIKFAPDGKSIAVGGRRVRIYPNQTLDELIATGCECLEDYFTTYPKEKEKLPACQ